MTEEQPISDDTLDRVFERLQVAGESAAHPDALDEDGNLEMPEHFLKVINAFDMPRLAWSLERNTYEKSEGLF